MQDAVLYHLVPFAHVRRVHAVIMTAAHGPSVETVQN